MKHISAYTKWKYAFVFLIIASFNAVAQITYVVNTAFKHACDSNLIFYNSDTAKLKGYLYKPKGKGPFPVYIWNHSDEKDPQLNVPLASFWTNHGFIFFMPIRSGQGNNPGPYIRDEEKQIRRRKEMESLQWKQVYELHEDANNDVLAALKWIKKQPFTDSTNMVVSGEGYGGIQVLLTAQKGGQSSLGIKCFMAFSPGSETWSRIWGDSLKQAINKAKKPIFILHTKGDPSPPSPIDTLLGPLLEKKEFPNRYKLFPIEEEFSTDPNSWEKDVMQYLKDCGVKRRK